jgi:hypothetical protein
LIFDPTIPKDRIERGTVDVTVAELAAGWRNYRTSYRITGDAVPRWLSGFSFESVPEIAAEVMTMQQHRYIAMHPPHMVWTSGGLPLFPLKAVGVTRGMKGNEVATAGVFSKDSKGRIGITTALHAVERCRSGVFIKGIQGELRSRDKLTDSCFIEVSSNIQIAGNKCAGPLRGMTPGKGETAWFEGVASGRVETEVHAWTPELPWIVEGSQSRILTPLVTNPGDSGAALINGMGRVIGFALNRTGYNAKAPHSAWIWAESVFSALNLLEN